MQCGPIRHSAARPESAPAELEVWPQVLPAPVIPVDWPIQEVFRILVTRRLIGEGFDHPPLDALVLAMPISWKGTLQQYAARLHPAYPQTGCAYLRLRRN
jgi:hypothetical protein